MCLVAWTAVFGGREACGFYTQTLAQNLDSSVRVSRRVADDHYASILADGRTSVPARAEGDSRNPYIRRPGCWLVRSTFSTHFTTS